MTVLARTMLLAAACLAAAGCSCGGRMVPDDGPVDAVGDAPVNCQEVLPDNWQLLEWQFSDGTSGSTGCAGPTLFFGDTSASGQFTQAVSLSLVSSDSPGFVAPAPIPWPADCLSRSAFLTNIDWVTGATGTVNSSRYPPTRLAPNFYVEIWVAGVGTTVCEETSVMAIGPRSGRWEITQGGTFGDVIEVHVYDVEFELHDGRIFTITHGAWRGTVLGPRVLP